MNAMERYRAYIRRADERDARFLTRVAENYPGAGQTWFTLVVSYMLFLGVAMGMTVIFFQTAGVWLSWFPWMAFLFTFHFAVIGGVILQLYPEVKGLREPGV